MFALSPLGQEIEKLLTTKQAVDVVALRLLTNQLEFAWLRAIDEYARSEEWVEEGFAVAASALRAKCGLTPGGANASLKLASKLRQLSIVSEAFASGQISLGSTRR